MAEGDLILVLARVATGAGLVAFVGATLWAFRTARAGSPGLTAAEIDSIRLHVLEGLDRMKFVAAGALLVGVLLEVQVMGSSLPEGRIARAVLLFVAVASHVYAVMVVQPRGRYYRERIPAGAGPDDPWRRRTRGQERRNEAVAAIGLALAIAAVLCGWRA